MNLTIVKCAKIILLMVFLSGSQNAAFHNSDKIDLALSSAKVMMDGNPIDYRDLHLTNRYRVLSVMDGGGSADRASIMKMKSLIDSVGSHYYYTFLVYIQGEGLDSFDDFKEDNGLEYGYPLLYDWKSVFNESNKEVLESGYTAFLLDVDNNILEKATTLNAVFFEKVVSHSKKQPQFLDSPPILSISPKPN